MAMFYTWVRKKFCLLEIQAPSNWDIVIPSIFDSGASVIYYYCNTVICISFLEKPVEKDILE